MSDGREFRFQFDEALIRAALRRDFLTKSFFAVGFLGLLVAILWIRYDGLDAPPLLIAGGGALALILRVRAARRSAVRRRLELWTRQAPDRWMTWRLDDEGFEVECGTSRSRHAWLGLRRLWCYHDVWLIEVVEHASVFFPPAAASEDARRFIVDRCREAGVRV